MLILLFGVKMLIVMLVICCYNFKTTYICLQKFLEQKKLLKTGLNIARFREHVGMIVDETEQYFKRWGSQGTRG